MDASEPLLLVGTGMVLDSLSDLVPVSFQVLIPDSFMTVGERALPSFGNSSVVGLGFF